MATIVLVHGGWHGGWVWRDVAEQLIANGHHVLTPTLTGLGERSHLAHSNITPDLHVTDIINLIKFNELNNVLLVGHSYGGMIITGVASHMPDNVSSLVYLDAFVPTASGQSSFSIGTKERADEVRSTMTDGYLVPPSGIERWVGNQEKREWLASLLTPHPAKCFSEGLTLHNSEIDIAKRMFILCSKHKPSPFWQFHERYKNAPGWFTAELDCLHNAMIEKPNELVQLIQSMT